MHELSLVSAVLDAVGESAAAEGISRVTRVHLVIGQRHGALQEALRFAFEALTSDASGPLALFRRASLEIEERPTRARCRECGLEYGEDAGEDAGEAPAAPPGPGRPRASAVGWALPCPRCGNLRPDILSGEELLVDYYEGQ